MSEDLRKTSNEYLMGKVAYDAYCGNKNINWKSKFTGADLPQFENNLPEIQEAWIESAVTVKMHTEEKQKQYCLKQDDSCHWYLLPVEFEDEFESLMEKEADDSTEIDEKFGKYKTGGGIGNIRFANPSYYPF